MAFLMNLSARHSQSMAYLLSCVFLALMHEGMHVTALGKCSNQLWFQAVRSGDTAFLSECLDEGFPVDARDELGQVVVFSLLKIVYISIAI